MGICYCLTKGCAGYFCSVDLSTKPHAPHCEHAKGEPDGAKPYRPDSLDAASTPREKAE